MKSSSKDIFGNKVCDDCMAHVPKKLEDSHVCPPWLKHLVAISKQRNEKLGISEELLAKYKPKEKKVRNSIHTELHELVANLRKDFGETAEKGTGSFSFYLGLLKKVPVPTIYMWYAEIKQSPNLTTPLSKCKIFWWKYSQWKKKSKVIPLTPKA